MSPPARGQRPPRNVPLGAVVRRTTVFVVATVVGIVLLLALKPHHLAQVTAPAPDREPTGGGTAPGQAWGARSGTYTGDTVDTRYGPVQVAATLTHGRLTAVRVLQAPSDNDRDREIAAYALPRLTDEALAAQSAHIDAVSGASYTSEGYAQSLQSALDQVRG